MTDHPISRRPFLKTALGAGLAASLARGQEKEEEMPEGKKLGWALVGLSRLSEKVLGPALQKTKHARLAGIVTGTPEKAKAWQKKYDLDEGSVYNYDNFDEMMDNPEIDVVYVVLPNSMHMEFALRAARMGKHVYMEKPMATSSEECRKMIAACEEAGVKLGMAYRLQFEPHHLEVMRFAREEVFGKVQHVEAGFGIELKDADQWRLKKNLGGGALLDLGVYVIQAARYIFGEEPVSVSAIESKTDQKMFEEVDETITWMMKFPSGGTASLLSSYNLSGYNRLTVFAEEGRFGLDPCFGFGGQEGWTSNPEIPLKFPETDQFEVQMDLFSKAVIEKQEWKVDGEEGLKDHLVMEAVFRSITSGRIETVAKV